MTGLLMFAGGAFTADTLGNNNEHLAHKQVVILPTAAAYEHPDRQVDQVTSEMVALGASVEVANVLARADALDAHLAQRVTNADCVALIGGSAQHAKSVLTHSPVWDGLVAAWNQGATILGCDAGAQILGDPMVDSRGGAFTLGLGLVANVAVVPKWNTWSDDAKHRLRELGAPDVAVIALDESGGVVRASDGSWSAMGSAAVEVFVGGSLVGIDQLNR